MKNNKSAKVSRYECLYGPAVTKHVKILVIAVSAFLGCAACGVPSMADDEKIPLKASDYEKMIERLANTNEIPTKVKILGDNAPLLTTVPLFPSDYDWDEYHRVRKQLRLLSESVNNESWAILVQHLEDEPYAMTYTHTFDGMRNASVGSLCRKIAQDSLTYSFRQFTPWISGGEFPVKENVLAWERKETRTIRREWLDSKKGKQLWELQVKECEWAITEAPGLKRLSESQRTTFVEKVSKEIERLKATHQPAFNLKLFFGRDYTFYQKQVADKIREKYEAASRNEPGKRDKNRGTEPKQGDESK